VHRFRYAWLHLVTFCNFSILYGVLHTQARNKINIFILEYVHYLVIMNDVTLSYITLIFLFL
jgi:hypothetical protein